MWNFVYIIMQKYHFVPISKFCNIYFQPLVVYNYFFYSSFHYHYYFYSFFSTISWYYTQGTLFTPQFFFLVTFSFDDNILKVFFLNSLLDSIYILYLNYISSKKWFLSLRSIEQNKIQDQKRVWKLTLEKKRTFIFCNTSMTCNTYLNFKN